MCSYCQMILFNCPITPHTVLDCPARKSTYCHICCAKGHTTNTCPNRKALAVRNGLDPSSVENFELFVKNDADAIINMLHEYNIKPLKKENNLENISLLQNLGNSMSPPHKIVFTP